ncbi:Putative FBD-associated F-box protein At5g22720 [Linum perenne]
MIQGLLISDPRSKERIQSSQIRSNDNNQSEEGEEEEDPFSSLPDEIIHQILARLQSPEQVAQFNTLSRKWARILSSYPNIEYKENYYREEEPKQRFLTAMLKKLSQRTAPIDAIRIEIDFCSEFYTDFHDRFLDSAAKFSPLEIDISFGCGYCNSPGCTTPSRDTIEYEIPRGFFSSNGKQFVRLNVLKLKYCRFDQSANFSCLGSSLKVLCLEQVIFPNEGILHTLIHEASLLETLTLKDIWARYHFKLQVRNHPNLKLLEVDQLGLDLLEMGGIQSLEEVRVTDTYIEDFRIWSVPNLKLVYSEGEIFKLLMC